MSFVKRLILLMSIAAALAADKDKAKFEVSPAASYPSHQTSDKVTIGASVLETEEQAHTAFGKLNPNAYGILPVLVVIQNDSGSAIRVENLKAEYIGPDHARVDSTPPQDLKFLRGAKEPKMTPGPLGGIHVGKGKKNPLGEWELEGRAFSAKMIPPGQTASGFFYFQTGHRTNSTLYVSGIQNAATGQELLYFEVPLARVQ